MQSFSTLWENHPTIKGDAPLLDHKTYPNQCAVNLYAALERSGFNVSTFRGQLSWQKDSPKYAIRAQEVADWLARPGIIPTKVQRFTRKEVKEVFEKIKGKSGVIFLMNYWGPNHQGDHIDLWNGSHLTDWKSWARIHLYISWEGVWTDFRGSESVWFWELP